MFSIKYIEKSDEFPNGQVHAQIFDEASWIYKDGESSFSFEVWLKDKLIWNCNLSPNTWARWNCLDNDELEAFIKDKNKNIISRFKLDYWVDRNATEQFFDTWIMKNPNSSGIVIGTHDGTNGEWVKHIKNNKANAILVEASENQFNELSSNYIKFDNVKLINEAITSDGRETEFYEFGLGHCNTFDKSHYENHKTNGETANVRKVKSVSINDLIIRENLQNSLDWIHLDTESIDDEIIMGLDFSRIKKPKLIVFETINFSKERTGDSTRIDILFDWLKSNGYSVKYDYWNSFAFLQ
jgi:FkbM family methyltransferase